MKRVFISPVALTDPPPDEIPVGCFGKKRFWNGNQELNRGRSREWYEQIPYPEGRGGG